MSCIGKTSKFAISRNFPRTTAGVAGIWMLKSGSITIIYCASTIDHIWFRDAEKIKLTRKLPITKPFAPFPADVAITAIFSSNEPIWIWRGIWVARMNEESKRPSWSMNKAGSVTKIIITSGSLLETRLASVKFSWMFIPFSLKSVMFQRNWSHLRSPITTLSLLNLPKN